MKVNYLSASNPDYQILERFLASGEFGKLKEEPAHLAHQNSNLLNKLGEQVLRQMPHLAGSLGSVEEFVSSLEFQIPTRFDSPLSYNILAKLIEQIREVAETIGLDVTNFPNYACVPTGEVNACAVDLSGASKPFLLFDSQIFMFCHLFSKTFALCLPGEEGDDGQIRISVDINSVEQRIAEHPEILQRLEEVLLSMKRRGVATDATPFVIDAIQLPLSEIFRKSMELFVTGHEFGHVYAGHLGDLLHAIRRQMLPNTLSNQAHREEHEADTMGMVLTLHAMTRDGLDPALSYVGIDLFFSALDFVDLYCHVVSGESRTTFSSRTSNSHPSNLDRRNFLRDLLPIVINDKSQAANAILLADQYEVIANRLVNQLLELKSD